MPKYQLGQRVRYSGIMDRMGGRDKQWQRVPQTGDGIIGIIVGKRTCSDGHRENWGEGNIYVPSHYHSFWLVAHNLSGYRYVAEADIVAVEQARRDGTDGYEWQASKI